MNKVPFLKHKYPIFVFFIVFISLCFFAFQNCSPIHLTRPIQEQATLTPPIDPPIDPPSDVTVTIPGGTPSLPIPVGACGLNQTNPGDVAEMEWLGVHPTKNYGTPYQRGGDQLYNPQRGDPSRCRNAHLIRPDEDTYIVLKFNTPTVAQALASNQSVLGYLAGSAFFISLSQTPPESQPQIPDACSTYSHVYLNWALGNIGNGQGGVQINFNNRNDVCRLLENTTYYMTIMSKKKMRPDLAHVQDVRGELPTKLFDQIVVNEGFQAKSQCEFQESSPVFVGINADDSSRPQAGMRNGINYRGLETGVFVTFGASVHPATYVDPSQRPNQTISYSGFQYPVKLELLQTVEDLSPTGYGLYNALKNWDHYGWLNTNYWGYGFIAEFSFSVQNKNLPPDLAGGQINPGSIMSLKFRTPKFGENAGVVKMMREISPYGRVPGVTGSVRMSISECPGDFSGFSPGPGSFQYLFTSGYNLLTKENNYLSGVTQLPWKTLKPDTDYYLNYKITLPDCGEGQPACESGNLSLKSYSGGYLYSVHEQQ